jgi:hypothetical protein
MVHVVAISLLLTLAFKAHTELMEQPKVLVTPMDFKLTVPPPMTMPVAKAARRRRRRRCA